MKVLTWEEILTLSLSEYFRRGTALSIGSFDGPHLGHLTLFREVLSYAKNKSLLSGLITFKKPLSSIKMSSEYWGDISTLEERLCIFEKLGFDFCIVIKFDSKFANIEGQEFFEILRDKLNLKFIVEGVDFKCGHKGTYDKDKIEAFCKDNNLSFAFMPLLKRNGERISSTKIRELLHSDSVSEARNLLVQE